MNNSLEGKKLIAFTGFARSGKGSFSNSFEKQLKFAAPNLNVQQFSFAESLRQELAVFIQENFGIDVFTEDTKEKEIIRPILISYGNAKRKISNNKYWIEKLEKKIVRSNCDVAIINDLRFAETEEDELGWLKNNNGKSFHIKRFIKSRWKVFEKAPNEFEEANDEALISAAKQVFEIRRYKEMKDFMEQVDEECSNLIGGFL